MTKEEIIEQHCFVEYDDNIKSDVVHSNAINIYTAMEEYSKQESIAFAEWCTQNYEDKNGMTETLADWESFLTREHFTTEQLYNLYLQSKQ